MTVRVERSIVQVEIIVGLYDVLRNRGKSTFKWRNDKHFLVVFAAMWNALPYVRNLTTAALQRKLNTCPNVAQQTIGVEPTENNLLLVICRTGLVEKIRAVKESQSLDPFLWLSVSKVVLTKVVQTHWGLDCLTNSQPRILNSVSNVTVSTTAGCNKETYDDPKNNGVVKFGFIWLNKSLQIQVNFKTYLHKCRLRQLFQF